MLSAPSLILLLLSASTSKPAALAKNLSFKHRTGQTYSKPTGGGRRGSQRKLRIIETISKIHFDDKRSPKLFSNQIQIFFYASSLTK